MSSAEEEFTPKTQPEFSGGPPRPPKITARDLAEPTRRSWEGCLPARPHGVRDLASAIGLKPFQVVADLMDLRLFKRPDDIVDFETAAVIVRRHGYRAEKPPPGTLVL